jgi:hypothetical protein
MKIHHFHISLLAENKAFGRAGDVAQWKNICLAWVRPLSCIFSTTLRKI